VLYFHDLDVTVPPPCLDEPDAVVGRQVDDGHRPASGRVPGDLGHDREGAKDQSQRGQGTTAEQGSCVHGSLLMPQRTFTT
jgi:hypothetical protein